MKCCVCFCCCCALFSAFAAAPISHVNVTSSRCVCVWVRRTMHNCTHSQAFDLAVFLACFWFPVRKYFLARGFFSRWTYFAYSSLRFCLFWRVSAFIDTAKALQVRKSKWKIKIWVYVFCTSFLVQKKTQAYTFWFLARVRSHGISEQVKHDHRRLSFWENLRLFNFLLANNKKLQPNKTNGKNRPPTLLNAISNIYGV